MSFDQYDQETLSVICPVCSASVSGLCLQHKRGGGMEYLETPHEERVLKGHGKSGGAEQQ
jgi:hypothetical protein